MTATFRLACQSHFAVSLRWRVIGFIVVMIALVWSESAWAEAGITQSRLFNPDYPWERIHRALKNFKHNQETIADYNVIDYNQGVVIDDVSETEIYDVYKKATLKLHAKGAENTFIFMFLLDQTACAVHIKKPLPPRSFNPDLPPDPLDVLKIIQSSARRGNPKQQLLLGYMYLRGDIVRQDIKRGEYWIHQAYPHTVTLSGNDDCPYDVIERM